MPVLTKRCPGCCPSGVELDAAAFARNRRRSDGLQTHCRACRRAFDERRYREHPRHASASAAAKARRVDDVRRHYLTYLLEHPCPCSERDPVVLEFHHTRGKIADVSKLLMDGASWPRLRTELERGVVLCANCHRRAEAAKRRDWRVRWAAAEGIEA